MLAFCNLISICELVYQRKMKAVKQMLFSGKPESEHEKNDLFHKQ